jgi:hypothetical protein
MSALAKTGLVLLLVPGAAILGALAGIAGVDRVQFVPIVMLFLLEGVGLTILIRDFWKSAS